jgi:hypothetical protein
VSKGTVRFFLALALATTVTGQSPPGLRFEVSFAAPQPAYQMGERISLRHCFSAETDKTYSADSRIQDRVGRQNGSEDYEIEPASGVTDPLQGTGREARAMGGLSGGNTVLATKPFCFDRDLNEYVRFLKPGTYRLRVRTNRVQTITNPSLPPIRLQVEPGRPSPAVSNRLELRIIPARPEWRAAEMASIRARLNRTDQAQDLWTAQEDARRELRYLFTREAALEMLNRFRTDSAFHYYLGLLTSPFRAEMSAELEQRIVRPDWPLDTWHVECLDQMWSMATYPRPVPYSQTMSETQRKAFERENRPRMEGRMKYEDALLARVVASLDRKQGAAAGRTVYTLIGYSRRYPDRPVPAWRRTVAEFARRHFELFDTASRNLLLGESWRDIRSPLLAPVLERDLAADPRFEDRGMLLERLTGIDPDRARRIVLDRLRRGAWDFEYGITRALPESMPPEIDGLIADAYEHSQPVETLIARYGGPAILPKIRAQYERRTEQRNAGGVRQECLSPLHFYFLRVAPEYGRNEIERMLATPSSCLDLGWAIRELGPWAYSPALEQLAVSLLTHPSVPVKRGAAAVLGWYGSPEAKAPLWSAIEYWHNWWKGRADELKNGANEENVQLERALRTALASAAGWLLTPGEWSRLTNLCVTDWCASEVNEWRQRASVRPEVNVVDWRSPAWFASVGPYQAPTEAMFLRKLSEYPPGTEFEWSVSNGADDFEAWRRRFAAVGMKLDRLAIPGS